VTDRVAEIQKQIQNLRQELTEARRTAPPEPIGDYDLTRPTGEAVHLSDFFGDKDDLIVIHNMGTGCSYCTLWADGFVSMLPHLQDRAGFVVVTPDSPTVQRAFATSRNWTFPMASAEGTSFFADLGFDGGDGKSPQPGFSALHRNADGTIERTGRDDFGPGDDYAPIWHFFDALKDGTDGWEPKYRY
jgi:predicted dithiol-disulfide oxidoreductase (DUF899 family)